MELEYSPLTCTLTDDGRKIEVYIYREKGASEWLLEVVDEDNNSSVWEDTFEVDKDALDLVNAIIREEGFDVFLGPGPEDEEE